MSRQLFEPSQRLVNGENHSESLSWALGIFLWHTLQNKHFAEVKENLWIEGAPEESLVLIRLHAIPWSCIPLGALQSSEPPRWLSQPLSPILLGITFQSLRCAGALNGICFVPAMGIIPSDLGFFSFPVCEVIHIGAVMHYELCESGVCVLRLDPLTQARSVNGQDFCFSSFTPAWALLSVHHRPQGLLITSVNVSVLFMLHASFPCWSSLFLPAVVNSDSLITVKCC